jgi:enoyl-CoA hydratase/carnithine racemase
LILTGAVIRAEEAFRIGLLTRVVLDVESETDALLERLSTKSAIALGAARRALRQGGTGSFAEALARTEALYREAILPSADAEEGVRAFLEKRPPRWQDR